jgi:hypothetical protein
VVVVQVGVTRSNTYCDGRCAAATGARRYRARGIRGVFGLGIQFPSIFVWRGIHYREVIRAGRTLEVAWSVPVDIVPPRSHGVLPWWLRHA